MRFSRARNFQNCFGHCYRNIRGWEDLITLEIGTLLRSRAHGWSGSAFFFTLNLANNRQDRALSLANYIVGESPRDVRNHAR